MALVKIIIRNNFRRYKIHSVAKIVVKLCQSGKAHVCFVKTEKEGITVEKTQQSVGAYHIAL